MDITMMRTWKRANSCNS